MAWENLRNRRTRTRLTIAGVVVGTCAIIIMVSIGVGIDKMITSQYQSDSTLNKITVYPMGDYTNDSGEVQKEMPFDDSAVNYFSKLNNVKTVVPTLEVAHTSTFHTENIHITALYTVFRLKKWKCLAIKQTKAVLISIGKECGLIRKSNNTIFRTVRATIRNTNMMKTITSARVSLIL